MLRAKRPNRKMAGPSAFVYAPTRINRTPATRKTLTRTAPARTAREMTGMARIATAAGKTLIGITTFIYAIVRIAVVGKALTRTRAFIDSIVGIDGTAPTIAAAPDAQEA